MILKRLSIIVLAAAAISIGAYTAFASARHDGPEKRIEHMKKALNLSDAQVSQIKTIYKNNQATFKADREAVKNAADGSDAKKAAFQKMRADMRAVRDQITPILTADQQAKWKDMMAKHEHGRWQRQESGEQAAPQQN